MREIKFRMWDKKANKYFYDPEIFICLMHQFSHDNNIRFHIAYDHVGDGSIFEQFSGLLDKNGVEIYEGDIVSGASLISNCLNKNNFVGLMCWDCEDVGFFYESMSDKWPHIKPWYVDSVEVIGNIHENPELLEKK